MTAVLAEGIERVATFSDEPEFTVLFESSGEVSYMWLNTEVEAFQDEPRTPGVRSRHQP